METRRPPSRHASPPTVACPTCGARAVWSADNAWRPFCSERCKNVDLGAWANDEYSIPVTTPPEPGETSQDS